MQLPTLISNPFSTFTKLLSVTSYAHFWSCEYRGCEVTFFPFNHLIPAKFNASPLCFGIRKVSNLRLLFWRKRDSFLH
ncbi:hypothetical protein Y032_0207g2004 [Ancylostoma ceylanicum]|uniref:Uncharacterized protein n=1 Tax=Ancylostoma ceylanicum TaxID=53326 RepID=A0A016SLM6_9BILA|nr:hypothetical protein Y032_0207g2004 [Ancylostoma ceylanicum]